MTINTSINSGREVLDTIAIAKEAQVKYSTFTQEQVDHIIKQVAEAAYAKSAELAELAVEETGMGVVGDKKLKNDLGSMAIYESIIDEKTVGIIREDEINKVTEIAYPFGVVAGITPVTNPTSTAIFKVLIALKTRNAIVLSPHPTAAKCSVEALKICYEAAVSAGAPEGIIGWIAEPSLDKTTELMQNTDLILATGGAGLVKAAYSSGKPAYGVGPGNVPCYVEKSANLEESISMIIESKSFDNGVLCSSEGSLIIDKEIKEKAISILKEKGAYLLNADEKEKIENLISTNPKFIGQSAPTIADMAGISVPDETKILIAEEDKFGKDILFSLEKLAPILGLYTVDNSNQAKEYSHNLLNLGGRGHTLGIHTNNEELAKEFAIEMPVSRILVNTLCSIGAAGATTGLKPSITLGCGAYGGTITSDNLTAKHLINVKRMAYGV